MAAQAVPAIDVEKHMCGYARLGSDGVYKLVGMRRNPIMDDGELHLILAFTDDQIEAFASPAPAEAKEDRAFSENRAFEKGYQHGVQQERQRWEYRAMLAAAHDAAAEVLQNGLTRAETSATASVAGLTDDCDMGIMCLGCTPRNADGSCPSKYLDGSNIKIALEWLQAALRCPAFNWDFDQHTMAKDDLCYAQEELKSIIEELQAWRATSGTKQ